MTEDEIEERRQEMARAWLTFKRSGCFPVVMGFIREHGYADASAFSAADYDPIKAASIDGKQQLVMLIEDEITNSQKILNLK